MRFPLYAFVARDKSGRRAAAADRQFHAQILAKSATDEFVRINERKSSTRRHGGADFGAQFVDQLQAAPGLDVPEGPTVAGGSALRHRADAVDRADLVA